jgi:hypothetical protein
VHGFDKPGVKIEDKTTGKPCKRLSNLRGKREKEEKRRSYL